MVTKFRGLRELLIGSAQAEEPSSGNLTGDDLRVTFRLVAAL